MGNEASTLSDSGGDDHAHHRTAHGDGSDAHELGAESCGFRVLGIQEQSPASRAGFVSFFDFILEANGIRLDTKDSTLMELIAQSEDAPMQLTVYNVKSQTTRALELTPSRAWPGKGLLGVTIRFDSHDGAEDQLLHVLHVEHDSPAHCAGLRPETDYLLGTPERVFRDSEDLHDELLDALNDSFQCYVYNTELDQVRIVSIAPREHWGGDGVLGAEVAHGYLHRLPTAARATVGMSVGFVSLATDATAATDAFLRRVRPQQQPNAPAEVIEHEPRNDAAADTNDSVRPESPRGQAASAATATEPALQSLAAAVGDDALAPATAEHDASAQREVARSVGTDNNTVASTDASAASVKPRYTARTDARFPISTVAVYADPTQLS